MNETYKRCSLFLLSLGATASTTNEANTTNDEPLTSREGVFRQTIDGVAAIVGDKTILKSDINQALSMAIFQQKLDPNKNADKILQLKKELSDLLLTVK
jgi:hypothetical protein